MAFIPVPSSPLHPLVSIGLPVFNGEAHLAQAITSLLAQSFKDFEIIISDNASTDGTRALCEKFMRDDPRIRYIRQPRNIGAPLNWSFVVHEARGQYFKWASANDYCSDRFLEECLAALQSSPDAVLVFGKTCLVGDEGDTPVEYKGDMEVLDERPSDRFRRVSRQWALNNAQSGVFRTEVLRKSGLMKAYVSSDLVMMAELALHGCFKRAPGAVLFRRTGNAMSMRLPTDKLRAFIDPLGSGGEHLMAWPRHRDRIACVLRTRIGVREKIACLGIAIRDASWDKARLLREFLPMLRAGARMTRGQRS